MSEKTVQNEKSNGEDTPTDTFGQGHSIFVIQTENINDENQLLASNNKLSEILYEQQIQNMRS